MFIVPSFLILETIVLLQFHLILQKHESTCCRVVVLLTQSVILLEEPFTTRRF
jgi:hypothetical protein